MSITKKNSKVYTGYILSNLLLIGIACCMVCSILLLTSTNQLRRSLHEEHASYTSRLAAEIKSEITRLYESAEKMILSKAYSPSYFERNAYYEIELIEELAAFESVAYFPYDYFLLYYGRDAVYTATGKNSMNTYAKAVLGEYEEEEAERYLRSLTELETLSILRPDAHNERLLIAVPVYTAGRKNPSGKAVLCFWTNRARIVSRLSEVAGEISGRLVLTGPDGELMAYDVLSGKISDSVTTEIEPYGLTLTYDASDLLGNSLSAFISRNILILLLLFVPLVMLGVHLANRHYMPILQIADTHDVMQGNDELKAIDTALRQTSQTIAGLETEIADLKNQHRNYLLRMLFQGETRYLQKEKALHFPGDYFMVAWVDISALESDIQPIVDRIEGLSGGDVWYYVGRHTDQDAFPILINLKRSDLAHRSEDFLRGVLQSGALATKVGFSSVSASPADISRLQMDAADACSRQGETTPDSRGQYMIYNDTALLCTISALVKGDLDAAGGHLREFVKDNAEELNGMSAHFIQTDTLSRVLRELIRMRISVRRSTVLNMCCPSREQMIVSDFERLFAEIAPQMEQIRSVNSAEHPYVLYLRSNCYRKDLSLEMAAEENGVSPKHFSRVISETLNISYLAFVTQLRMEQAQKLLTEGDMPVAEVGDAVGYPNVSYFIKVFRKHTGLTPANYRSDSKTRISNESGRS